MSSATNSTPRIPAEWIHEVLRVAPARVPVGHSIRAGISVGVPFVAGALSGHVLTGMWIGLATLLLAAGEREGTYRQNFWIIAVSTPIAASGYLVGSARDLPLPALILLAGTIAFAAGAIAGLGAAFSVAGMQFLLVAAIALGVPDLEWWRASGLYFVGAVFYSALLAIEMLINPRRPQRIVTVSLLRALADLSVARAADLRDGGDRTADARRRSTEAYRAAVGRASELASRPSWSTRVWVLDGEVLAAADRVQAFVVAETDAAAATAAADRLAALATEVGRTGPPGPRGHRGTGMVGRRGPADEPTTTMSAPSCGGLAHCVDALALMLHGGGDDTKSHEPLLTAALGREVMLAACRLALCYAVAVGAKLYFPFSHWFWVPLTVCLVMKPDFGSVFSRAVLRILGTAAGAAIATAVLLLVPKGWALGVVIGLLAASVPYLMMRSYALQAVAIAPAVILLVDAIQPGGSTANFSIQRVGATLVGGVIVLVFGYLIWPHSRRTWIAGTFETAMDRIADHLARAAEPVPADPGEARRRHDALVVARRASYRALSDLQFRLRRALAEPGVGGRIAAAWIPAVSSAEHLADLVTAYAGQRREGLLPAAPDSGAELAAEISAAGGYPGAAGGFLRQRHTGGTGSESRNGDEAGDSGWTSDPALTGIHEALVHLQSVVVSASEAR